MLAFARKNSNLCRSDGRAFGSIRKHKHKHKQTPRSRTVVGVLIIFHDDEDERQVFASGRSRMMIIRAPGLQQRRRAPLSLQLGHCSASDMKDESSFLVRARAPID